MNPIIQWIKKYKFLSVGILLLIILIVVMKSRSIASASVTLSEPISRGTILESVYGIGTITARHSYQLKLGVTSTLLQVYVAEGDHVHRGQKLVKLEGSGDFAAPFEGTVTSLPLKVGETIFSQVVILSLVDLLDRYIVVSLEQRAAIRVRADQKAKLSFENMREQSFEGVVQSVYSNDNNFLVRIGVSNLPPQLLPGMTADVSIAIAEHPNVLIVPTLAIDTGKVYIQRAHGQPEPVEIKTGVIDGVMAEVISGEVHEGDRLSLRKKIGP